MLTCSLKIGIEDRQLMDSVRNASREYNEREPMKGTFSLLKDQRCQRRLPMGGGF
jgi:hypothetical protein